MNHILYTAPTVAVLFVMLGCCFAGIIIGLIIGFFSGKASARAKEPRAWMEARLYRKTVELKEAEVVLLKARLSAVRMALDSVD